MLRLQSKRNFLSRNLFHRVARRWNSSSTEAAPLFLWLGEEGDEVDSPPPRSRLLLPPSAILSLPQQTSKVDSPSVVLDLVNQHYSADSQFVGGMGESDPGVWFIAKPTSSKDTLEYADLLQTSIAAVKEERHGVPFGAYTSGIFTLQEALPVPLTEIGLDCLQVSLFAASPDKYSAATGLGPKQFGQVCGFIADAAEQGVAVEAGVLASDASAARDLALSLGARHTHVYEDKDILNV